ncbi:hypothetical protein EBR57_01390 [bacterium]|nr:hypothetical protein [bacterium]
MKLLHLTIWWWIGITGMVFGATAPEIIEAVKIKTDATPPFKAMYRQVTQTPFSPQSLVETGWLYQKGRQRRKEIQTPIRKVEIQSDTVSVNPTPISKTDIYELISRYQFVIQSETPDSWTLAGHYQTSDLILTVSKAWYVPTEIRISDVANHLDIRVKNAYKTVANVPILTSSNVTVAMMVGSTSTRFESQSTYSNVQIESSMPDSLFQDTAAQ